MVGNSDEGTSFDEKPVSLSASLKKLTLFVLITGGLLYGLLSVVQPQYRSQTILYIQSQDAKEKADLANALVTREVKALSSGLLIQSFLDQHQGASDSEGGLSNSAISPLSRVAISLGISKAPTQIGGRAQLLTDFKANLSVAKGSEQQTIQIAMRSSNPELAAQMANQYAAHYIARLEAQSAPRQELAGNNVYADLSSNLRAKVAQNETRLALLQEDFRANPFAARVGREKNRDANSLNEAGSAGKVNVTLEQLSQLTAQHILAKADLEQAQLRAKLVRDMLEANGRIESTSTVLNSGLVQKLLIKRARMEQKRADLSLALLPSHPQLSRHNREMSALSDQINEETQKAVANLENEVLIVAAREDSLKQSLAKLTEARKSGAQDKQVTLTAAPLSVDPRIVLLDGLKELVADSRRKLMVAETQAQAQASAKARLRKDAESSPMKIKAMVISPAIVVSQPVFPKKKPITLLGMLAAFALGLMFLAFGRKGRGGARAEGELLSSEKLERLAEDDLLGFGKSASDHFAAKPAQA